MYLRHNKSLPDQTITDILRISHGIFLEIGEGFALQGLAQVISNHVTLLKQLFG
jgi:hypothetical protein